MAKEIRDQETKGESAPPSATKKRSGLVTALYWFGGFFAVMFVLGLFLKTEEQTATRAALSQPPSASSPASSPNAAVQSKLDAQCSESRTKIDAQADVVRKALRDDFGKTFSKADILAEMQKATSSLGGNRECADIFATLIVMLGQQ